MKRGKVVAFFLSLAIHLIIFSLIWWLLQKTQEKHLNASSSKRVDISLQDFITPPQQPKPLEASPQKRPVKEQKPKVPPKEKEKVEKKEKNSPKKEEPKTVKRKVPEQEKRVATKKETPAPKKATAPKPKIEKAENETLQKKEVEREVEKQEAAEEKRSPLSKLAGALGVPAIPSSKPSPPSIAKINDALFEREFKALYKDDFDRFTPEQKKFIKDNLSRIQGITQHYLTIRGYPYLAARLGQSGMNIVEFDLHPNGDITDLKVIKGSESEILDKNSLDTIKTAYKDYPRPKEVTKIRFYIYYRLY